VTGTETNYEQDLNKRNTTIVALCQVISITVAIQQFLECVPFSAHVTGTWLCINGAHKSKGQPHVSIEHPVAFISSSLFGLIFGSMGIACAATTVESG
jgi:hypothetical protein